MRILRNLAAEKFAPKVMFDVGANIGRTAILFRKFFPESRIFCFEPVNSTFSALQNRIGEDPLTEVHRAALGRGNGTATVRAVPHGLANRLVRHKGKSIPTETVAVHSGDVFCNDHKISRIDFLKIDAEGGDLDVLVGFQKMLLDRRIEYIQVECGISRQNRAHIPLENFNNFLSVMGYGLLGLFDGVALNGKRGLWYCNAVFVAETHSASARREAAAKKLEVKDVNAA